jgi:excisionase family DNA binding protein
MASKSPTSTAPPQKRASVLGPKWDSYESFTVKEAAQILRLGRCAAYAAVASGEIPTLRFGRRIVIPRQALEKMLAGG